MNEAENGMCTAMGTLARAWTVRICGLATAAMTVLLAALPLAADDGIIPSGESGWPQWRGPRRDGVVAETGLLEQWPDGGPKLLWKADGLGTGWSSPIIVGERLFITGDVDNGLVIFALDLEGNILWRRPNGESWRGPFPGARATCTYSDRRLYHLNAHGRLACLDAASGSEQWSTNILERFNGENITWALSECLLVDGARVIVTPGGKKALMAALDKTTGSTLWTTEPLPEDKATHSSPLLFRHAGRRMIANCSSAHGFGVDADTGELLWTVPLTNRYGVNTAMPVYSDGCVFFVTPYAENGRLYRLQTDGGQFRVDLVWTHPIDTVTGCGLLVGDRLLAAGYRRPKHWFAIDWATGETEHELEDFTTGAAVYADRRVYIFDEQANVGLVRLGPDGLELTGRFRLPLDRVRDAWAHPVVYDGRLYVRYHDTLWCFGIAAD